MPVPSEKLILKRSNPLVRLPRKWINDYFTDMEKDYLVVLKEFDGSRVVFSVSPNQEIIKPGDSDNATTTNNKI